MTNPQPKEAPAVRDDLAHPSLVVKNDGRLAWRWPSGKTLPYVAGGDGPLGELEREIGELRQRIAAKRTEADAKRADADKVAEDARKRGVNPLLDDGAFAACDEAWKEADRLRDEAQAMQGRLERALERVAGGQPGPAGAPDPGGAHLRDASRHLSAAERAADRFVRSEVYTRMRESGVFERGSVHVDADFGEVLSRSELRDELRRRTTFDKSVGGSLVAPDLQLSNPIDLPVRKVTLLDLLTIGETDSDTIKWVKMTVRGDAAAAVPFGTALPEAGYTYTPVTTSPKRIGQWIPAMKDMLADAAQTRTLLESDLLLGVRLESERQALLGDGTGENWLGMLNTPGIGAVVTRDGTHATEYNLDAIHRAITAVRLAGFVEPTSLGLHPTNKESLDLQKDAQGRYIYPPGEEIRSVWGLVPYTTPLFTLGTGLVGDLAAAAKVWLRTPLTANASDSHADFFIRGMVAIAAEYRAAFAVQKPFALAKITGL